jgi:hypothetical protein
MVEIARRKGVLQAENNNVVVQNGPHVLFEFLQDGVKFWIESGMVAQERSKNSRFVL